MKKFIATLALFVGLSTNASVITIETNETNVVVGETLSVNLVATDFASLDTFDINFDFDTSLFSYDSSSLVSDLSLSLLFEVTEITTGLGISFFDIFAPVDGDFLLASFDLLAIGEGSGSLGISDAEFASTSAPLGFEVSTSDTAVTKVSAPATLGIFALAGLALVGFRRKA